jgi:4-amino-4-deoxy-L-arabinose transferase-like glycosyltransferase
MPDNNKATSLLLSLLVFMLFFGFYFVTSNMLPRGAGPDWKANMDVSRFIYEHKRLAVLPDDEASLHFTAYGSTRALRPPLSYIVSALAAKALEFTQLDLYLLLRKGSALLCALAVALAFYAVSLYFNSYRIGLLSAAIIGLMPQFAFIASYNNDDSGAIFSATLMIAALVRVYRHGMSTSNAVLVGLATGLILISKMTAWLMLPFAMLFLLYFVRAPIRQLSRYAVVTGLVLMLTGGWWFVMNISVYGMDDPILHKISAEMAAKHQRQLPDGASGYASRGIGYYDLLVKNHDNFLGETAKSTIGNLDWLRLRLGPLQYFTYLLIFYIALLYFPLRVAAHLGGSYRDLSGNKAVVRQLVFEALLFGMIIFQIFMYTWANINNDIQIQGKYIIPIFLAILVLFFSALASLPSLRQWLGAFAAGHGLNIDRPTVGRTWLFLSALLFLIFVHWDAWVRYVIPFYKPPAYTLLLDQFQPVSLARPAGRFVNNLQVISRAGTVELVATGSDPRLQLDPATCQYIRSSALLEIDFVASRADTLVLYIDQGNGFSEPHSFRSTYQAGPNHLLLPLSADNCQQIRFDPFVGEGSIKIQRMQIAPLIVRPAGS